MSQLYTKSFVDVSKFVIWGDAPEGEGNKRPRLVFSFRDGNPRLTVYTGTPGAEGVISFPSDYSTMVTIVNLIKDIAKGESGHKVSIDSLTSVYENNQPTAQKKVVSSLFIGKSKEGLVYLSIITENKPKLVFTIKPSPYHIFRDSDKNEIPVSEISAKMAIGLADLILNTVSNILIKYTEEEYQGDRKPTKIKGSNSATSSPAEVTSSIDDLDI